ncbi:unnamed protein product [Phytophthora fragariaefolia]|uniref:Unnamed protein product n=1 Tax=Phytophthora fragariaefolia TaxID=1490495 RepID=A0A9W6Y3W2_9STRA|nr:unnamed protein product [Phytophthora fragariaefolia]
MIEWMLDCGYIRRDITHANDAIASLVQGGRLDLMQQIVLLHSPPREQASLCLHSWWNAIKQACEQGYLEMLQWLMDHPLGRELRRNMKAHRKYSHLIRLAGQNDQAEIMGYLYEQGGAEEAEQDPIVIRKYADELRVAIRYDRCNPVKWLVENIAFPDLGHPGYMIINITTKFRRFNILQLLHELGSSKSLI